MRVEQSRDGQSWCVVNDDGTVAADNLTHAGAWSFVDRFDERSIKMENTRRRIADAFVGKLDN